MGKLYTIIPFYRRLFPLLMCVHAVMTFAYDVKQLEAGEEQLCLRGEKSCDQDAEPAAPAAAGERRTVV